jgi:hypothetical protein
MSEDSSPEEEQRQHHVSPPVNRVWYDSWAIFDNYIAEYQRQTSQLYRVRTSTPAATRNKKIRSRASWSDADLIPENLGPIYRKYECTHANDKRKRGKWKRHGHLCRSTGCPVQVSATLSYDATSESYRVKVTRSSYAHNHAVDKRIFDNYASQRQVDDEGLLDVVNELHLAGSKTRLIHEYLKRTTSTVRDVLVCTELYAC